MSYPRIIVDTNKILAAALKQGKIRTILYQAPIKPLTPPYILEEAEKHVEELSKKAHINPEAFLYLLRKLVQDTTETLKPNIKYEKTAREIASKFDLDDWPFIALALQEDAPIWTNDKEMLRDAVRDDWGRYVAVDTDGVEMLLQGRDRREVLGRMREKYCRRGVL
jgi:predicted nucleic acid-binding protein